ncbi:hypothetical protein EJ06DRAFT_533699 [Trichodelitschia bisporula]|uniref:Uncharacterized protein n=1 Tax=Trichodelitschia bisporula TaxID=703511 RepID=A0A6G1HM50_9PEZI|nr:hypothetical protein EJ06DRAFT_533699 [Trichodelitschia bisporula]
MPFFPGTLLRPGFFACAPAGRSCVGTSWRGVRVWRGSDSLCWSVRPQNASNAPSDTTQSLLAPLRSALRPGTHSRISRVRRRGNNAGKWSGHERDIAAGLASPRPGAHVSRVAWLELALRTELRACQHLRISWLGRGWA